MLLKFRWEYSKLSNSMKRLILFFGVGVALMILYVSVYMKLD